MEKIILKHLTVTGFAKGIDLSKCEALEKKLESSQIKLVAAQKEVNETKEKLSIAVAESLKKLEEKENKMTKNIESESNDDSAFGFEDIKASYTNTMAELD